jgi:hypothetical protein
MNTFIVRGSLLELRLMSDSESDSGRRGEEEGGREEEDIFALCCEEDVLRRAEN